MFQEYARESIQAENTLVLVAEVDGKLAVYCLTLIQPTIRIYRIEKLGRISGFFIRNEFRSIGLSSQFKNTIIKWLETRGITHIAVTVAPQNKQAHRIYKKWGFKDYQVDMRFPL